MNDATKKKQGRGVNPLLAGFVVLTVVVIGTAVLQDRHGTPSVESNTDEAGLAQHVVAAPREALSALGKTLLVGPVPAGAPFRGTTLVPAATLPDMEGALSGGDVNALVDLMEKHQMDHLVVSPAMVKRNPLPANTVLNRLALAHPAGRLTAVYMTRDVFVYHLGQGAPPVTQEDKYHLLQLVLNQVDSNLFPAPDTTSPLLQRPQETWVFLVVRRRQGAHVSYHSVNGGSLASAAAALGRKMVRYYAQERFVKAFGPLSDALGNTLGLEMEIVYDRGVFTGPRDRLFMWRIIEPGIYGFDMLIDGHRHSQPPWYSITANYRTLAGMMERIVVSKARKEPGYWLRADVPIWRFRTIHWRQNLHTGGIEDLYRAMPRIPKMADVTRDALLASLKGFGDWFVENTAHYADDRMVYRYFPTRDEENAEYNGVRHALGAYSMALVNEMVPTPAYRETGDAALRWMESRIRWGGPPRKSDGTVDRTAKTWMNKPLPGKNVAILEANETLYDANRPAAWSNKMGTVAVAILGYTQYKKAGWSLSDERHRILLGLAEFLLYMQREDGSFHHYYVAPQNPYYGVRNSIYPGEILYALARLYGETNDVRFKDAFDASLETNLNWFKREMTQREADGTYGETRRKELVQFQPWIAMAMEEMYRHDPDNRYLEASTLVSRWVMDTYQYHMGNTFYPDYLGGYLKVLDELPAMHTFVYTEGVAASYALARRAGAPSKDIAALRQGALLAARFVLQQQIRPNENDYFYPTPRRAVGGVKYCINHNKQRIDYSYHALSSVYRILQAATPEDYRSVQEIALPGGH